jgi:hypothetical protein
MKKLVVVLFSLMLLGIVSAQVVSAADYTCPAPAQVNCVPATTTIGPWTHNGGQMTGNTFAPNTQCANVIPLPGGKTRLLCCYTKCGVFTMDVPQKQCTKTSESKFSCR